MSRKKIISLSIILSLIIILNIILVIPFFTDTKRTPYEDITDIVTKLNRTFNLTEEEFNKLSRQTGLSKTALQKFFYHYPANRLFDYQEDHINNRKVIYDTFFSFSYQEKLLTNHLPFVDIVDGDILVTSTSYTFGYRHGHAGLVISAKDNLTLESYTPFIPSSYDTVSSWLKFRDVMVLRLKEEYQDIIKDVIKFAEEKLVNVKYSIFSSTNDSFDSKGNVKRTQCSHLVYLAYKQFGIDLNSDGGWLVTANDISKSSYLDVIEVKGFNYDLVK